MQSEMEFKVAVSQRTVAQAIVVRDFAVAVILIALSVVFAILATLGVLPVRHPGHVFTISLLVAVLAAAWLVFQRIRMPRSKAGIVDASTIAQEVKRQKNRA